MLIVLHCHRFETATKTPNFTRKKNDETSALAIPSTNRFQLPLQVTSKGEKFIADPRLRAGCFPTTAAPEVMLLLVNHFIAAAWYLVGSVSDPDNNWIDAPWHERQRAPAVGPWWGEWDVHNS